MKKKVVHITNWYPHQDKPFEAIWIKRHIEALAPYCDNEIWHVKVRGGKKWKKHQLEDKDGVHHIIWDVPFKRWFLIELCTTFLLWQVLRAKVNRKEIDLLNFHIAYPLLTYWGWLKRLIKVPVVVTEHWSAYRFNFGLPLTAKLPRIKRIFKHDIDLITVSNALKNDIVDFANAPNLNYHIVPNLVDVSLFEYKPKANPQASNFIMVSNWAPPKRPLLFIEAFGEFVKKHPKSQLTIVGFGSLIYQMEAKVKALSLEKWITFEGKCLPQKVASLLQEADFLVHPSDYETFSVVCAEALCTGTPVLASAVGGIVDFVHEHQNGLLVTKNTLEKWIEVLDVTQKQEWNHQVIAKNAANKFSREKVGKLYSEVLLQIINDEK